MAVAVGWLILTNDLYELKPLASLHHRPVTHFASIRSLQKPQRAAIAPFVVVLETNRSAISTSLLIRSAY